MLREYLSKYSQREQLIIISGGILVGIWLLFLLLIEPLINLRTQNEDDLSVNRELLVWMQDAAQQVKAAGGGQSAPRSTNSSAVVVVESSLKQSGLGNPKRIEPNGNNKAIVQYDPVDFDKLMRALDRLEHEHGIGVTQATINKTSTPGMVSALLNLERS